MMETKKVRGHEVRNCCRCGDVMRVPFSDARAGLGKYCSYGCASEGRSHADAILDAILDALPAAVYEIAERLGVKRLDAVKTVKRMVGKGLVYPSGMKLVVRDSGSEYHTLVYSAGKAPDGLPVSDLKQTLLHYQHAAILEAMPGTAPQLAERAGLHVNTVARFLKAMRGQPDADGIYQAAHIRSWRRPHGGCHMPVYQRGAGKDVPDKFTPLSRSERYQRQMAKLKRLGKIGQYRAEQSQQRKERRTAQRRLLDGDPMLNALFGTPADRRSKDRRSNT